MSLTIGKRDIKAVVTHLDQEWDDVEDLAQALLRTAWEIYETRSKYTVVGQLWKRPNGEEVTDRNELDTVAVGVYGTEAQAKLAAVSLAYSTQTHEMHRTMVVPLWWGTPATYYAERKRLQEEAASAERTGRAAPDQISA